MNRLDLTGHAVPVLLVFSNVLVQTYVTLLLKFGSNIMYPFEGHVLEALLLAKPWGPGECDLICLKVHENVADQKSHSSFFEIST